MASRDSTDPKLSFSTSSAPAEAGRPIRFFELPRVVQDRFVATTQSALWASHSGGERQVASGAIGLFFLVTATGILSSGVGSAESSWAILGWKPALAVAGCLMAVVASGMALLALREARKNLPFAPGTYLLPIGLVVAKSADIRLYPWSLIAKIERRGPRVLFTVQGVGTLGLAATNAAQAQRLEEVIVRTRAEVTQLQAVAPERAALRFDPFHVATTSSPLGPQESLRPSPPLAGAKDFAIAIFAACAVASVLVTGRNFASDRSMWAAAKDADTAAAWRAYIAAGGFSWHDAEETELPHAELRELERRHDLDATLNFAKAHHDVALDADVRGVVRRGLLFNLEKVRLEGTVAAIDSFAKRYPTGPIAAEVTNARHAIFTKALERYRPLSSSPLAYASVERIVRFAEKRGSVVQVRALVRPSSSMAAADKVVRKSRLFQGEASLPSRWLQPDAQVARTDAATARIAAELAVAFPADVLTVTAAGPMLADEAVDVPTIYVSYSVEWSRVELASTAPKGVFIGIDVPLAVGTRLPGEADEVVLRKNVRRSPEAWRFAREPNLGPGSREEKIYSHLLDKSFATATSDARGAFVSPALLKP